MKQEKKALTARFILILVCLAVFCLCFWQMNQTYDPLARYPYATDENRDILLQYLDSEDIDYIISNQIRPEEFLEFIDEPGFDIHYCRLYSIAKQTQEESNGYIVNFVNRYRSHFSTNTLETLLEHYSYVDLTTFYENDATNNEKLTLVADPSAPYVLLSDTASIYKYVPEGLVSVESTTLKENAVSAYEDMKAAYKTMLPEDTIWGIEAGYEAYDQIFTNYTNWSTINADHCDEVYMPEGQNELQLGYSIMINGASGWMQQCLEQETVYQGHQYDSLLDSLDEQSKVLVDWLQENAYRYGFVIRYPQGKESVTGHLYNPFILRYVGVDNAKTMVDHNWTMEEMKFEE